MDKKCLLHVKFKNKEFIYKSEKKKRKKKQQQEAEMTKEEKENILIEIVENLKP